MSRWRLCEVWLAICAVYAGAAAVGDAPSVGTATALVALSCVPVASVLLWWSPGGLAQMPARGNAHR